MTGDSWVREPKWTPIIVHDDGPAAIRMRWTGIEISPELLNEQGAATLLAACAAKTRLLLIAFVPDIEIRMRDSLGGQAGAAML